MAKAAESPDDEDWIELERAARPGAILPEVSVRVTVATIGRGKTPNPKARVYVAFRGAAAEWIVANGPRFRVALGGQNANLLRIAPDNERGKFEFGESSRGTTKRLNLGTLAAWPNEERDLTAAEWDVSLGWMRLRLPDDFAQSRSATVAPQRQAAETPKAPSPSPVAVALASAATSMHAAKAARSPALAPRVIDHRPSGVVDLGGPPPGRSALDQRRAASA